MADAMPRKLGIGTGKRPILPKIPIASIFIMEKAVSLEGRLTDESGKALA